MDSSYFWRTASIAVGAALVLGCQPIQDFPIAVPVAWFAPPQQVPTAPALVAPALPHNTVLQPQFIAPAGAPTNPLHVRVTNQDWAWEQIVDVMDDYFRIEREYRVQLIGNVLTEGRIDTFPQVGATWPEAHRPDSVGWENRWESTFQTIRRRAVMRVIPAQDGYLVDVAVYKELEDLPRPENSTAGATFRNDNSLPSRLSEEVSRTRFSKNWIPQGRDPLAEQHILAEIQARLTQ